MKLLRLNLALALFAAATIAHADGGRLRLHQSAGPFIITLFTTPDPLVAGPADFSIAVERAANQGSGQSLIQDADVTLILTPADNSSGRMVLTTSHAAATSRFLQAANFSLPHAGPWLVTVIVHRGNDTGRCSGSFIVEPAMLATNGLALQIATVPFALLLFALHRWRKQTYQRKRKLATT